MDSEVFADAKDWEEIVKKKFEKKFERVSSEKEREICTQAQKIKKLEEVQLKQNEIERLSKALQRADQRNGELHTDTRQLRKSLEDAEMKIRLERRKMSEDKTEKEKHEKFILELREKVKIEEMERDRVRRHLQKRRAEEREYFEFQKFKKRRKYW